MRTVLVDASIFVFRSYFSLPPRWQAENGFATQAVYGYVRFLVRLLGDLQPSAVACAFDESLGSGFRHRLCPAYKSNRELPDEGLAYQLNACREVTALFGIAEFASQEFEADDLIASLAAQSRRRGIPVTILSRDKDLGQILEGDDDEFWDFPDGARRDIAAVTQGLGVSPAQIADLLALSGDPVDAIAGVPGIGRKTAVALLNRFGDCDVLLAEPEAVAASGIRGARRLANLLIEHAEQLRLSRQLTRLRVDAIPWDQAPPAWSKAQVRAAELEAFLQRNGLRQLRPAVTRLLGEWA